MLDVKVSVGDGVISGVLLDIAGVLYEGDHALPGAVDSVKRLRESACIFVF